MPGIFVFAVVGLVAAWGVWQYQGIVTRGSKEKTKARSAEEAGDV